MEASAHRHKDVAKLLLDSGANIEARNNCGQTALMYTFVGEYECEYENFVKFLLGRGANINAQDNQGKTVLMLMSEHGRNKSVVEFLLNHGANVKMRDNDGQTAFVLALQWGTGTVPTAQYLAPLTEKAP